MEKTFKKLIAAKVITIISIIVMANLAGFSQTYSIVETGQTISYDTTGVITIPTIGQSFYGQNSNHPGNLRSYTNNGNGTVTDNLTGLMWQQTEDRTGDGVIDFYDKLTYAEALAGASTCNTGGYK